MSATNGFTATEIQNVSGIIETSNALIWYTKFYTSASENNIPLICLHGGPGFSHHSMRSLKALAPYHPVILYDQSGCGNSKTKDLQFHDWTFDYYLQELHEFVTALGYEKIYLLGLSWGGTLAAQYALEHQEKLAGLVLASPLVSTKQWVSDCKKLVTTLPLQIAEIMAKHEAENTTDAQEYQDAVAIFYKNFLCRLDPWPSDLLDSCNVLNMEIYKTMWGPYEMTATGNLKDVDLTSELHKIKIPTLVTCGRFDLATPESMQNYVKQLPNAKLVVFEQSAHMTIAEESEKYMAVTQEFLASCAQPVMRDV